MASIPGLTTRETAVVAWLAVFLGWVLTQREIRASLFDALKMLFGTRVLVGLLSTAVAYAIAVVSLLQYLGYWDFAMTKTTVVWFLGVGFVTAFSTKRKDGAFFRRLVLTNLSVAFVIEFVTNLYTFPLLLELVLVPAVVLFVATYEFSKSDPKYASGAKLLGSILTIVGLAALTFSVVHIVREFDEVVTWHQAREFLLPLVLTTLFIPFLYVVALYVVYDTMLGMLRFGLRDNEQLYPYARRSIIWACGPRLARAQLFEEKFRSKLWNAAGEADVTRVVDEFRAAWEARRAARRQQEPHV